MTTKPAFVPYNRLATPAEIEAQRARGIDDPVVATVHEPVMAVVDKSTPGANMRITGLLADREVYALCVYHEGKGAYRRDVLRLPMSVVEQYRVKPTVGDVPGLVEAAAVDFVRRVVEGREP